MRRFLPNSGPLYNPEYDIDISSIKVTDYGNIELLEEKTLINLQNKLTQKMMAVIENNSIPIVIGGTKDVVYGSLKALSNSNTDLRNKIGLFAIQKYCDSSKYDQNIHFDNTNGVLRFINENENTLSQVIYYATEKYDNNLETNKFKHEYKNLIRFVHYEDIKKASQEVASSLDQVSTKAGKLFLENLTEQNKSCEKIHFSVSLEAINVLF
jgi:arginase family enzyme